MFNMYLLHSDLIPVRNALINQNYTETSEKSIDWMFIYLESDQHAFIHIYVHACMCAHAHVCTHVRTLGMIMNCLCMSVQEEVVYQ